MNVIHYHTPSGAWSVPFLPPVSLMCRDLEQQENWPTIWQLKECQIGSHESKGGKKDEIIVFAVCLARRKNGSVFHIKER